jgi:hypothetical protein
MSDAGTATLIGRLDPDTADDDFVMFENLARAPQTDVRDFYRRAVAAGAQRREGSAVSIPAAPVSEPASEEEEYSAAASHQPEPAVAWGADSIASRPADAPPPALTAAVTSAEEMVQRATQRQAGGGGAIPQSYLDVFRRVSANRGAGQHGRFASEPRPAAVAADPSYAERRELLCKIDTLRNMGFAMPTIEELRHASAEDLSSEVRRRTSSVDTMTTVDSIIAMIDSAAKWLQLMNSVIGSPLPLETYAEDVSRETKTPRFKYAIYQLVLRYKGTSSSGPWREILIVLLLPIIQALVAKVVVFASRGRIPLDRGMIASGLRNLTNLATGRTPRDGGPNDGGGVYYAPPPEFTATTDEPTMDDLWPRNDDDADVGDSDVESVPEQPIRAPATLHPEHGRPFRPPMGFIVPE